jgi:hypothetical protein
MDNKLNQSALKKFSKDYADAFFLKFAQERFSGPELKNLAQHKQVNLQVIALLFEQWQSERARLQSPFFDFDVPEVQAQLDALMNVLSRHIAVGRKDLRPLLEGGVNTTIQLIFDPYRWWQEKIQSTEKISPETFAGWEKFILVNKALPQAFQQIAGGKVLSKIAALDTLAQAWAQLEEELEDTLPHVKQLSQICAPDLDILYQGSTNEEAYTDKPKVYVTPTKTAADGPAPQKVVHTLYDTLSGDTRPTLADTHRRAKVDSLAKIISINQRFMFQKELFGGDQKVFQEALQALEACRSYDEAEGVLSRDYISRYQWDLDSEEAGEFLEVLARRFGS